MPNNSLRVFTGCGIVTAKLLAFTLTYALGVPVGGIGPMVSRPAAPLISDVAGIIIREDIESYY